MCILSAGLAACGDVELSEIVEHLEELPQLQESLEEAVIEDLNQFARDEQEETDIHGYYYETLSEHAKVWYQDIYEILIYHQACVKLNSNYILELGPESIDHIFDCVLMDHPEIFYVTGYEYVEYTQGDILVSIEFSGDYDMNYEQMQQAQTVIGDYVDNCMSQMDLNWTDYEKVKYVYEYLIQHTQYNLDAQYDQSIYSVCAFGESVCQGYAKMAQYLLNKSGVETTLVQGYAGESKESHVWNLVLVDGYYYYVDVTWGDSSYYEEDTAVEKLNYDYLCVTTEELCKNHFIDNIANVPSCDAIYSNYYVMEGAYFQVYDEARIEMLIQSALANDQDTVAFKCCDNQVFRELCDTLFEKSRIFDFLPQGVETVSYLEDENMLTLTILLKEE